MALDLARYLDHIATDGKALADAATQDLSAPVAACPGWTVRDLVGHMGHIHRWAATMVATQATSRLSRRDMAPPPKAADELIAWSRQGVAELLDALRRADPDAPVWNWSDDPSTRFWFRRQAQETTVHRWDAEHAATVARPIAADLAADGIDELLDVFARSRRPESRQAPPGRLRLVATDIDRSWDLAIGDDGQQAAATGPASELVLFLWGRRPPEALSAQGDISLLARWQDDVKV